MKVYNLPKKDSWSALMQRPVLDNSSLDAPVSEILKRVKNKGDAALLAYTKRFDGAALNTLRVSAAEYKQAENLIDESLKSALKLAKENIEKFHGAQRIFPKRIETSVGVYCWQKQVPIQKVGLYIPGGSAPLFSTLLMLGVPAQLAGCKDVVVCSPPDSAGKIHPAILYTAQLLGIGHVYKVGGAQAVAAMAFGTESIPQVYKIFGPGNQFVTKAKELVQTQGVAIDLPAGPSEVLVIADESTNAKFVAADLLSQAEHGPDSQVVLLSTNRRYIDQVLVEIDEQVAQLPRGEIAEEALGNSRAVVLGSLADCMSFSNAYAPEHLILACENAAALAEQVVHAGSVFIGPYSCESAGDYASGTNHTLPTNGFAASYSGVSLGSFTKLISFQEILPEGLKNIGPAIEKMAQAEGLKAHKNAVSIRLNALQP